MTTLLNLASALRWHIILSWERRRRRMEEALPDMRQWKVNLWRYEGDNKLRLSIDTESQHPQVDTLIYYLQKHFKALVVYRMLDVIEGGGVWKLWIKGDKITVQTDWDGEVDICSETPTGEALLEKIAESIRLVVHTCN